MLFKRPQSILYFLLYFFLRKNPILTNQNVAHPPLRMYRELCPDSGGRRDVRDGVRARLINKCPRLVASRCQGEGGLLGAVVANNPRGQLSRHRDGVTGGHVYPPAPCERRWWWRRRQKQVCLFSIYSQVYVCHALKPPPGNVTRCKQPKLKILIEYFLDIKKLINTLLSLLKSKLFNSFDINFKDNNDFDTTTNFNSQLQSVQFFIFYLKFVIL